MSDGPWIDTHEGDMWSYPPGHGRWPLKPGIRNDALWELRVAERTSFVALAHQWREAAVADGWLLRPTYGGHEAVERAWTLERDGFKILGLSRAPTDSSPMPSAAVHIWGPDRLAIKPPLTYDWEAIQRGYATCSHCGAFPRATERVGFAGRYCTPCAEVERPKIETPGWTE